jgi:hypothetical protein
MDAHLIDQDWEKLYKAGRTNPPSSPFFFNGALEIVLSEVPSFCLHAKARII